MPRELLRGIRAHGHSPGSRPHQSVPVGLDVDRITGAESASGLDHQWPAVDILPHAAEELYVFGLRHAIIGRRNLYRARRLHGAPSAVPGRSADVGPDRPDQPRIKA